MYVPKTSWQNYIDTILASGIPVDASRLRGFETSILDSFLHQDDAASLVSPTTLYGGILYVNNYGGDDYTAQVGNINKPYYSISAAFNQALNFGTVQVTIIVFPGGQDYTENNSLTANSNNKINLIFLPGTVVTKYTPGPLFEVNGCSYYNIYGRGEFIHYGSGGSSAHTHVYYDQGGVTGLGNVFEFKTISAQGGHAIWTDDGLGSSTPLFTKFKGDYIEGAFGACFSLQSSRNYHIEVDDILCTAGAGIEYNPNNVSALYVKSRRIQSTNYHAIFCSGLVRNTLIFDVSSCVANIFSGYYSYYLSYTLTGNTGTVVRVNNASPSTTINASGADGVTMDFIGLYLSIVCSTGGNFYLDKPAFAQVNSGATAYSSCINSVEVSGTFIYNGYSKVASNVAMVRLIGGFFVLRGTLYNATGTANIGVIQSTGNSILEIDPGSRIINGFSGTAFSIIIYSGTLRIKSFGKYFFNKAMSGSPTYLVGSSADENLNTSL